MSFSLNMYLANTYINYILRSLIDLPLYCSWKTNFLQIKVALRLELHCWGDIGVKQTLNHNRTCGLDISSLAISNDLWWPWFSQPGWGILHNFQISPILNFIFPLSGHTPVIMEEENYRFMYITMPLKVTSKSLYSIQNRIKVMARDHTLKMI